MMPVTHLKNGATFEEGGIPWRVIDYKHTHMSRGSGTIRVKCRNLKSGQVLTKVYKSGDRVEEVAISKQGLQYLYKDGDEYMFMHPTSFEQLTLPEKVLGEEAVYLKEGETVSILFWDELALGVALPPKMVFRIEDAAPGEKGDSASNVYKDAVLENGLKIRVPLFINPGDMVRVDTRDGSYVERA